MAAAFEQQVESALSLVQARAAGPAPKAGLVLGSGLAPFARTVADAVTIPNGDLPGFPVPSVSGHAGDLVLGRVSGCPVAVLTGRSHTYETGRADGMKLPLAVLRRLGCEILLLTNAAGSLRPEAGPGSLMMITDHINFSGSNPLFGPGDDSRFVDLVDAYDPDLRARLLAAAKTAGVTLHQGVYMWVSGPSFETPAEIRMAGILGADAVGMSTVPEVIIARQLGLRVAAVSAITNLAAGLDEQALDHAHTLAVAARCAEAMTRLLPVFLKGLA